MLYFIRNHQGYLKIGHCRGSWEARYKTYLYSGAEVYLIDKCEGTRYLEKRVHRILKHKGLNLFSEWFKNDDFVYTIWSMIKSKKYRPHYYETVGPCLSRNPKLRTRYELDINTTYNNDNITL